MTDTYSKLPNKLVSAVSGIDYELSQERMVLGYCGVLRACAAAASSAI
jgi:hypothetical protein